METHPLDSALTTLTTPDSEKAWHLLALLLSIGRPARPSELASRCTSFPASTHLVQRLCSIANSPLSLSEDLYVTPSLLAVTALAEAVSCSGAGGALSPYLGKRKRVVLDCGFVPSEKRRLIVDFENANEANGARKAVICTPPKIHFHMTDYLSRRINMLPSDVAVGVNKLMFNSPLFIEYSAGPSSCGVKNIDNVEDQMETNLVLQRSVNNTIMACVDDLEPTVPTVSDDLVLYEEANMHEVDSLAKSYLEKSKQSIMSPVLDENVSGSCKVTNVTILEDERIVGDSEDELFVDPGNPNGETENISQPHSAVSDTLPGIDSRKLEEEDYEDTISLKKRLIRILETRAKRPATDLSVAERQLLLPSAKVSNNLVLSEVANMLEKVSNDLVLYEVDNMLERTKQSIMSPALDKNVSSSHKVTNATILEDVRAVGDKEEELLVDSSNSNGESENLCSQPYAAVSDKLHGIDSRRLKEEDYEDTIPVKRHTIRHETQTICPETDFFSAKLSNDLVLYEGANMHEIVSQAKPYPEKTKQSIMLALDENFSGSCKGTNARNLEDKRIVGAAEEGLLVDPGNPNGETENLSQTYTAVSDKLPGIDSRRLEEENHEDTIPVNKSLMRRNETQTICPATEFYVPQKQLLKSSATIKAIHKDKISSRLQSLYGCGLEQDQAVGTPKAPHHKMDQKTNSMVHKSKQNCGDMHINERKKRHKSISSKVQPEKKELPNFDSYMVEEEEGSGGYGTVYRARTKNDRTRVAIKCPHANAHKNHANNELRMLERFGGKNFVIKYEGCIKNGNSNCFVLQHVEHDRPEILKKEIDVCELRWYGYCLFRALASLHKQGIVHRDVKPGNFLFSRKANKGYLIDFNLAMDLHQKYGNISKSRGRFDVNSNDEKLITAKFLPPITLRKLPSGKSLLTANGETSKGFKSTFDMKDLKKMAFSQMKANNDSCGRKVIKSQGADGSGITSVKDVTSTRTPSAERLREPLPCQGRKELISLVQEARESPNHEASSVSALMRKRVPAPPVNVDGKLFHVTPMPMHSTANGIGGPCLIRSRGVGKHKEGPCVGTKGFRAPEVLFRSPHQGHKIDVWSAGVTLLYLLIGRTPFFGEPEQNIKDIAKLRGSEDLWEVAKLHDRESSFPVDLYSTDCLPSIKLKDWCRRSTKRPDFFEKIPRPLFDLVDKCLTVNPRLRISAEEALKHEFFAPCHEELRKHRLQRQVLF
ncbi:hypothetical protein M0R45_024861 [Rubus argutus]|uniref:non-specific serine/threonine protein kinase n=1 Tax=Rubus argutus TaxID=59490 RepID=A0AAW1WVF8_RUBAR